MEEKERQISIIVGERRKEDQARKQKLRRMETKRRKEEKEFHGLMKSIREKERKNLSIHGNLPRKQMEKKPSL